MLYDCILEQTLLQVNLRETAVKRVMIHTASSHTLQALFKGVGNLEMPLKMFVAHTET